MGGCYIWYSDEGSGRAAALPSPLLAVPNVTAHLGGFIRGVDFLPLGRCVRADILRWSEYSW